MHARERRGRIRDTGRDGHVQEDIPVRRSAVQAGPSHEGTVPGRRRRGTEGQDEPAALEAVPVGQGGRDHGLGTGRAGQGRTGSTPIRFQLHHAGDRLHVEIIAGHAKGMYGTNTVIYLVLMRAYIMSVSLPA